VKTKARCAHATTIMRTKCLIAVWLAVGLCQLTAPGQSQNAPPQFMGRRWGIDEIPTAPTRSRVDTLAQSLLQMYRTQGYTPQIEEQLKKLLAVNLRKQSNIRHQPKSPVDLLIESDFDIAGLKLILDAQKRDFKANDIRIAKTLVALARQSIKQSKYTDALDFEQQALKIQQLYTTAGPSNKEINILMADCLEKTGQAQEANIIRTRCSSMQGTEPQSKYSGRYEEAQTGVELTKLQSTYIDYLEVAKQCPYSKAANDYLKVLIPTLISQRDNERATTLLRAQIEIYARTPNSFRPSCEPYTEPVDAMLVCYENLAAILKAQGKDKEASNLLTEVEAFLPDHLDYMYTQALAKIAVAAGAKDQAQRLIDSLCNEPHPWQSDIHKSMDIHNLYDSLGEKDKAQKYLPTFPGAPRP